VDGTVDGGTNGGAGDVINGLATANAFDITSANGGTVNGTTFANVENLNGGADIDTFTFTGALSGRAFGDGDDDIFNVENGGSAGAIDGGADIDTVSYADPARIVGVTVAYDTFTSIESLTGSALSDTLTGTGAADTFTVTAANTGTATLTAGGEVVGFTSFENLSGLGWPLPMYSTSVRPTAERSTARRSPVLKTSTAVWQTMHLPSQLQARLEDQ